MATKQTANVYIKNTTDGTAHVQLFHQNDSYGIQNGSWIAAAGQTVGPLAVEFDTGFGSYGILDWWSATVLVIGGSTPGMYQSAGTGTFPNWKECQLQSPDAGQDMTFTISATQFVVALASGGCSNAMVHLGRADVNFDGPFAITNVFVLMLENHSFDNIFGQSGIPGISHAATTNTNTFQPPGGGEPVTYPVASPAPVQMPTDPGHEFADVLEQLCGSGDQTQLGAHYPPLLAGGAYPPIDNSGFVQNYATTISEGPAPSTAAIGDVMLGFDTPDQLPVIYQLATEFALCDAWFSSMPGPTWPNRFFVHGGSSAGLDHSPSKAQLVEWETVHGFSLPNGSLFDGLTASGWSWRLYIDDTDAYSDDPGKGSAFGRIPQVSSLKGITALDVNSLTHFASDLQSPYPYAYTFIEPNWGDITGGTYEGGSSQHPMDDVFGGEGLIKAVYEAIRNSPVWNTSLLIVTYDEHGGFFDSVAPGAATPPGDGSANPSNPLNDSGFDFATYGIRVPAVVVSPWIPKGIVDHTVYDHASVPASVMTVFDFGGPGVTNRTHQANDVLNLCSEPVPRTDTPATLNPPAPPVARAAVSPQALAAQDEEPTEDSGNLPGFLATALKTQLELTDDENERKDVMHQFDSIRTRGDARAFVARTLAKVDAAREGTVA